MKTLFTVILISIFLTISCGVDDHAVVDNSGGAPDIDQSTPESPGKESDSAPSEEDSDLDDTTPPDGKEDDESEDESSPDPDKEIEVEKDEVPDEDEEVVVPDYDDTFSPFSLRIMAANTTSGNYQSYEGPGIRIFQAFEPDIVLIQELNYELKDPDKNTKDLVALAFGEEFHFKRGTGSIPNGVISRYPIIESGEWSDDEVGNRGFVWARIDVPGEIDLWAVSMHLLTRDSGTRNAEAKQVTALIKSNIPEGDYLVIGGDFNTSNRSESCISTFSSIVNTSSPYPAGPNGNSNTNSSRSKPYDWVLEDSDLGKFKTAVKVGSRTFSSGLVFDSRDYSPLSDVSPVQSGDSAASNMQHMAVIKDYYIDSE